MIGRKIEKKRIAALLKSNKSEFIAITGRRRVGKTYLIDNLLTSYYCFTLTGIQNGDLSTQLVNFGVKLADFDPPNSITPPADWQSAMIALKRYLRTISKRRKQVIFIDELPWVYTARSGFIQMLAHLWNDYLSKEKHFILVICGSATSWITNKIINDKGGLHNRITEVIHLQPFNIGETKAFLKSKHIQLSDQDIAQVYMTLGGIPYYLENIQKGESYAVAIERMCFHPMGILKNEYRNLYQALFNNPDVHHAIIAALASHPNGMIHKQIIVAIDIHNSGSYQRAFEELLVSGFIEELSPFGKNKRGAIYRLLDEYSIFYHRFMTPNPKYQKGIWQQLAATQPYKIWSGYAFESLCIRHIDHIKNVLGISAVYSKISSIFVPSNTTQEGFQIDLIINRNDNTINLCEIKFHAGPFTITKAYYHQLINKRQRFIDHTRTRKQVFYTFITNHGLKENKYALELVQAEVTLEEILG